MTKITKPEKFVFCLDEILERRGINPRQFASMAGIHYRTVLNICRNHTHGISLETMWRICNTLGIAPGDLVKAE